MVTMGKGFPCTRRDVRHNPIMPDYDNRDMSRQS